MLQDLAKIAYSLLQNSCINANFKLVIHTVLWYFITPRIFHIQLLNYTLISCPKNGGCYSLTFTPAFEGKSKMLLLRIIRVIGI